MLPQASGVADYIAYGGGCHKPLVWVDYIAYGGGDRMGSDITTVFCHVNYSGGLGAGEERPRESRLPIPVHVAQGAPANVPASATATGGRGEGWTESKSTKKGQRVTLFEIQETPLLLSVSSP